MTPTAPAPCPACGKLITPPPGQQVFACIHCRQEIRVEDGTLKVVVDPADFRRRPEGLNKPPDVFRNF